jgi:flavin reductase (DIM6/NTAB) family NADH-FMN oxidoreductase RutF
MNPNPEEFRQVMRQWATGVTIVSVAHQGIRHGMTVNSFTSLSLHPPLVLISLEHGTRTHEILLESGIFGVTILSSHQQDISDRFAGRHTEELDRFQGLETFTLVSGVPFLTGGIAFFDCRVIHSHEAATHTIFIGDVMAMDVHPEDPPLIYFNRDYRGLCNDNRPSDS